MTDTEYFTTLEQSNDMKDACRELTRKKEELYHAEMEFYEGYVRELEDELVHGQPIPWECDDCGEVVPIRSLETFRAVIKCGGFFAHGDC